MKTSIEDFERLLRYGMCPEHRLDQQPCDACQTSLDAIADVRELVELAGAVVHTPHAAGRDDVGRVIDLASALLDLIEKRSAAYGHTPGYVLHMVVMTWIDRMADKGLVRRSDKRVLRVTDLMGELDGERRTKIEGRS